MNGPKYHIEEEVINDYELVMRLTIKNWQESDESHFTCISTNSLGKADGRIQAYSKYFVKLKINTVALKYCNTYLLCVFYIAAYISPKLESNDYVDRDPLPTPEYYGKKC